MAGREAGFGAARIGFLIFLFSVTAFGGVAPAGAQDAEEEDPFHVHTDIEEIIVTASPTGRSRFDILQSTAILEGDHLEEELGGNIGETLDHLPGIANSYFGPGAGRPVIRGLSGDRLRILIGGIGSIDASATSPDHAVAVDPLTAKRIEVIRGPATLLYGNNALGGVVNVLDGRIPIEIPENTISATMRTLYGTNGDEVSQAAAFDAEFSRNWVVHFDGSWRNASDIDIPGFQRSSRLRMIDPLPEGEEESFGVAPNSSLEAYTVSGGLSRFFSDGFFGFSVSHTKSNYGIPAELEGEEAEEEDGIGVMQEEKEGGIRIDLDQLRVDFMGEVNRDFLIFRQVKMRFGWADYEHKELEGEEVGTRFLNDGWEGRVELVQQESAGLSGAMGFQVRRRNFEAIGAEAFVPPTRTTQYGIFFLEEYAAGSWSFQGGTRLEFQDVTSPTNMISRSFTGVSFSAGVSRSLGDDFLVGVTGHRTERAPNAEELFSNGPHFATQTFEVGDPALGEETAFGGEVMLRKRNGPLTGSASFFYTRYNDFIFEDFTGEEEDGLPIAVFRASDVRFYGGEIEVTWEFYNKNDWILVLDGVLDFVKAEEVVAGTPLPRIPPLSSQIGFEATHRTITGRVELIWADSQSRVAANELPTSGYFTLDASLAIRPFGSNQDITLLIQGRNLNDKEIRFHTSFLKDLVPAPGRSVRISLRGGF